MSEQQIPGGARGWMIGSLESHSVTQGAVWKPLSCGDKSCDVPAASAIPESS